jgi:hypothetical protein
LENISPPAPPVSYKVPFTISLPYELALAVTACAEKTGQTKSAFIASLIVAHVTAAQAVPAKKK